MNAAWTSTDRSEFPLDWNGPTDRPFEPFAAESEARPIVALLERVVRRFRQRIALLDRATTEVCLGTRTDDDSATLATFRRMAQAIRTRERRG